jgi:hypothetical protein
MSDPISKIAGDILSIPLDYKWGNPYTPPRQYKRRDGRRTFLYQFCYSVNGVFTELPTYVYVRSVNMRSAIKMARYRVADRVKHEYAGDYTNRGWHVYSGVRVPARFPKPRPLSVRARENMERFISILSKPILDIIDQAPAISDLFSTPLHEPS